MRSTLKYDIMYHIIVGVVFMKTKIIYISGNETFEMTEIRAAFEEVRATLGLDNDTILFGVPVDSDSALADVTTTEKTVKETKTEIIPTAQIIPETIEEPFMTVVAPAEGGVTVVTEELEPETENAVEDEVVVEVAEETAEVLEEEAVVPILSVLGGNEEDVAEVAEDITEEAVEVVIDEVDEEPVVDATEVTVEDIVDDSEPVTPMEKTLEHLLESMTPLREDTIPQDVSVATETETNTLSADDTDATLAQLASEFALNEDKIPTTPKAETSGKIGKLKNILPFKKAKREDTSLMGDLFGWAGIAANDEDFSIPGFFTQVASKK